MDMATRCYRSFSLVFSSCLSLSSPSSSASSVPILLPSPLFSPLSFEAFTKVPQTNAVLTNSLELFVTETLRSRVYLRNLKVFPLSPFPND